MEFDDDDGGGGGYRISHYIHMYYIRVIKFLASVKTAPQNSHQLKRRPFLYLKWQK